MKETIYLFVLCFCFSCNSHSQNNYFKSGGVILSSNGSIFWDDTISLFNLNNEPYCKIWTDQDGATVIDYFKKTDIYSSNISVKIFDDGYDSPILVFDAKKVNEEYLVFVNDEWKKIKYPKPLVYKEWDDFISEVYIGLSKESPLRKSKDEKSYIINHYIEYYYEVLEVDGDWLQVQCWSDCEGCPDDGSIIKGWVKWKDGNKLLIELYYIC